jgi:hypothetical protein
MILAKRIMARAFEDLAGSFFVGVACPWRMFSTDAHKKQGGWHGIEGNSLKTARPNYNLH